ncbi:MAG TPA: alpha/beta hydrolase domain-containing protein [Nitrolancea sp.]|nr:alpha/beta hydrolase domain-containing protein [Nitrolancea sp.]
MAVLDFEMTRRSPYAGGAAFGDAGAYDRIDGLVTFGVDPEHEANQGIVDLAFAPRDDKGLVRFRSDLCLLVPQDLEKANRRLIVELPNRGRKLIPRFVNRAQPEPPSAEIPVGDGWLMRHGYSVGWIGWQWDVYRDDVLMGLEAPEALIDGRPVRGEVIVEIQPNAVQRTRLLANRLHRPYRVAELDDPSAQLLVRDHPDGPDRTIPRDAWRFAREIDGEMLPSNEHIYLDSGFEPGRIYSVIYTTEGAPVVGTGLLAFREIASFLRYDNRALNPLAGVIDHAYGFGVSQTGRMIRHYLYLGLNRDEEGRVAYDGLNPHVAGARRGEFNHRFAQPSVQPTPSFGHLFPFADRETTDPYDAGTDGILSRQRARGGMPKVLYTNSSAEYWRGDGSLLHTDPTGRYDLEPEPESRIYLFASTQHGPGALPPTRLSPEEGDRGAHDFNVIAYQPLLRAALMNLDRWVSEGVEPPPSRFPRLADGTAVQNATVVEDFRAFPWITLPDPERLPTIRTLDLGPESGQGIGRYPATLGQPYPAYVSAVDADGNETGGIRLPDLTVPLGTFTGWNTRAPETGAVGQIMKMQGMTHFFQPTHAAREAAHDPRPSLEERYPSREAYLAQVRAAAQTLVEQRYVLAEDVDVLVEEAEERYDLAIGG